MNYPEHWLLNWTGHQGDVEETFSNGIRMGVYGGPTASMDEEQYLTDTAVPALTAWFGSSGAFISSNAKMLLIKFNKIQANGKYADQTTTHERAVNVSGFVTAATSLHPLQVSMVLSWRTNAAARGPASHGRIYVPRPCVAINAAGDMAGTDRVAAANAAVTLLNALDVSLGVPPGPVLRPSIISGVGSGSQNQIDFVVVDSALDIQRRRAYSQTREETSAPVTYT